MSDDEELDFVALMGGGAPPPPLPPAVVAIVAPAGRLAVRRGSLPGCFASRSQCPVPFSDQIQNQFVRV